MPLTSMTGFAREAGHTPPYRWAWELRSVNGRGLDVRLRTPPGFDGVADTARQRALAAFKRGTIQINLTLSRDESLARVRINEDAMRAVLDAVSRLPPGHQLGPLSLDGLLAVRGVVEQTGDIDTDETLATLSAALLAGFDRALAGLAAARASEGKALDSVLRGQIEQIGTLTGIAEAHPSRDVEAVRQRLGAQVKALLGADGGKGLDPARLHQEAVLLATRADIREELDRLKAHVAAAAALLDEHGAVGRRLDFLAQEFAREANTLSAKAGDVSLNAVGLELKTIIEQFREQVQNVE